MSTPFELPGPLLTQLAGVRRIGVITGAGVSAESGIQTYRGSGGLYDDPDEGDRTVEALSGPTLLRDPDRTWRVVAALADRARHATPNAGHHALVAIEGRVPSFVLLTQNVDGLHLRAGSRNVIEIHGDTFATLCTNCSKRGRIDDPAAITKTPLCPACGGMLRPDVVLFEELLPMDKLRQVRQEFYVDVPDVVLVVGTSALFPYITEPVMTARFRGRMTVEINPEETQLSHVVELVIRAPASQALQAIASAVGAQ